MKQKSNRKAWVYGLIGLGVLIVMLVGAGTVAYAAYQAFAPGGSLGDAARNLLPAAREASPVEDGLLVAQVMPDSPAAAAGIVRGDILIAIQGEAVNTVQDLKSALAEHRGAEVDLTVLHGDERLEVGLSVPDVDDPTVGIVACGVPYAMPVWSAEEALGGALVLEVAADGPAAQAGLEMGDLVVSLDDKPIEEALGEAILDHQPGDRVELGVRRAGETLTLTVTLGAHPDDATRPFLGVTYRPAFAGAAGMPGFGERPYLFEQGDAQSGVVVAEVAADSPAEAAGILTGDVIVAVNGDAVDSPQEIVEIIVRSAPGDNLSLTLQGSDGETREVAVSLGETGDGAAYLGVRLGPWLRWQGIGPICGSLPDGQCDEDGQFNRNGLWIRPGHRFQFPEDLFPGDGWPFGRTPTEERQPGRDL